MKRILIFTLLAVCLVFAAKNGRMEAFGDPFPINDAKLFNNELVMATGTGVRFVDESGKNEIFNSANGLGVTEVKALAIVKDHLYTVSSNGVIGLFDSRKLSFVQVNRSYEETGDQVVAAAVGGDFIVIAFENKIAFFDTRSGSFLISVSNIGKFSLENAQPQAVYTSGDSLFISLENALYLRKMDWENLASDRMLVNPGSWNEVKVDTPVRSMTVVNGELKTRSVDGSFFFVDGKEYSSSEDSSKVIFNGQAMTNKVLYSEGKSHTKWILPVGNGQSFFVGRFFVGYGNNQEIKDYTVYPNYLLGGTYEMTTFSRGNVLVSGTNSLLSYFREGVGFSPPAKTNSMNLSNAIDGPGNLMKALNVLPTGEILYSIWGIGIFVFKDSTLSENLFSIQAVDGTCIENYLEDFAVIASSTPAPDGQGFLVSYWAKDGYGIAYISLLGDVYCASKVSSNEYSGPMQARMAKDGKSYEVFVATKNAALVNGNGNVDYFVMQSPKNGGELAVIEKKELKTPNHGYPVDMAFAPDGVLWTATYSSVGYWESGDSILPPHKVTQFSGSSYSSIAVDPQGNVWIGSNGEGLYHLKKKKGSNDTLSAEHFGTRDGLLCDNIYDLALDSVSGYLWMAQNKGVTRLIRDDLRKTESFMTDSAIFEFKVYPNPFRPRKHNRIVFDFVAEDARVNIFNAGGKLVKSFADDDLVGGRVEWDGKDDSGNLVAPGIYTYMVSRKGKKKKMGKLIIAH